MTSQQPEISQKSNGRNWPLLIGGIVILAGLGLFVVIGLNLFGGTSTQVVDEGVTAADTVVEETTVSLPTSGPPLQVSDIPYEFTLSDVDDSPVTLSQFSGQPVIINYWATWCGPCRIEMPHLQHTHETYQEDGLVLLALNQDETVPEINAYFDELGLTFLALLDVGKETAVNYGVGRTLPTTFFINADSEITAIHRGPMTQSQIDGYLAETIP